MGWVYDPIAHAYENTATGEVLTQAGMRQLRDEFLDAMGDRFKAAARELVQRGAGATEWDQALGPLIEQAHAVAYQLGRGGQQAMTDADWNAVAARVEAQQGYAVFLAEEGGAGTMDEEEAADRSDLYAVDARASFARGYAASWDAAPPEVPPRHAHCRCELDIDADEEGVAVYWRADGQACELCAGLAGEYNPWRPKDEGE